MTFKIGMKPVWTTFLLIALLAAGTFAGLYFGYQRGYDHGEKITNKWWIDQQSRYYDKAEVAKKRRALALDTI